MWLHKELYVIISCLPIFCIFHGSSSFLDIYDIYSRKYHALWALSSFLDNGNNYKVFFTLHNSFATFNQKFVSFWPSSNYLIRYTLSQSINPKDLIVWTCKIRAARVTTMRGWSARFIHHSFPYAPYFSHAIAEYFDFEIYRTLRRDVIHAFIYDGKPKWVSRNPHILIFTILI